MMVLRKSHHQNTLVIFEIMGGGYAIINHKIERELNKNTGSHGQR
jgi:hypothetical protein